MQNLSPLLKMSLPPPTLSTKQTLKRQTNSENAVLEDTMPNNTQK